MKTFVPFKKSIVISILVLATKISPAQLQFSFTSPQLVSGTALKLGAVYKFNNVMSGAYALVSIDSLVNGATVGTIDDNSSGLGYLEAFQPSVITPGLASGLLHEAYAVFKISFYDNISQTPLTLQSVTATALDIDGNLLLKELAEINMNGGSASYMSTTLDIAVNILLGIKYRADNLLGIERPGIDTSALGNMFTVTNSAVSSFKVKYGAKSLLTGSTTRQYSLYMKGFTYPAQATLPVTLVDFTAKYNKTDVTLNWVSTEEINFNYYELEHSTDGYSYSTTCIVFGAGTSRGGGSYSYVDRSVAGKGGLIYYRLKMVDIDGKEIYSPVRIVRLGDQKQTMTISVYPNPVSSELRVTLPTSWQNKAVQIQLFNSQGQVVKSLNTSSSSQTETFNVSELGRGAYFIKASCRDEVAEQKIIKN
jgi:hypothetical protein